MSSLYLSGLRSNFKWLVISFKTSLFNKRNTLRQRIAKKINLKKIKILFFNQVNIQLLLLVHFHSYFFKGLILYIIMVISGEPLYLDWECMILEGVLLLACLFRSVSKEVLTHMGVS